MDKPVRKCTVINDFSGFGRCSIAVALPVISAMGIQCCAFPTAILSNHTGYPSYYFNSCTDSMPDFQKEWEKLSLCFNTIYSGFLGCEKQIDIVCGFFDRFKNGCSAVLVDPVMGDNGRIYATYTKEMYIKMRRLASKADIITPNVTEACLLIGEDYRGEELGRNFASLLLDKLCLDGQRSVLITGIISGEKIETAVFDSKSGQKEFLSNCRTTISYPGTGDLFASVLCGAVTRGISLFSAAKLAADFVQKATAYTARFEANVNDGIAFEPLLKDLIILTERTEKDEK